MSAGTRTPRSRRELVADVLGALNPAQERQELARLLDAELLAVEVYELAVTAQPVSAGARRLLRQLGAQERAHGAALARLATLPQASPPSPAGAERALASHGISVRFGALRTERQWFTLLENLEGILEGVYYRALGRLSDPVHATLAARILASEAQHSTLLLSFRNPRNIQLDVALGQIKGSPR
jgi:hypothetical protein